MVDNKNEGWGKGWLQDAADKAVEKLKPETNPMEMTIHITKDGECNSYQVKGTRIGDLIVHPDPTLWGEEWVVSHVPTLVSFEGAVPDEEATKEQLINWCKKVQQDLRDDWEALATLNYKSYHGAMQTVKDRVQKHCLAIPL